GHPLAGRRRGPDAGLPSGSRPRAGAARPRGGAARRDRGARAPAALRGRCTGRGGGEASGAERIRVGTAHEPGRRVPRAGTRPGRRDRRLRVSEFEVGFREEIGGEHGEEVRRAFLDALGTPRATDPDDTGTFEVTVEAETIDDALLAAWNAL